VNTDVYIGVLLLAAAMCSMTSIAYDAWGVDVSLRGNRRHASLTCQRSAQAAAAGKRPRSTSSIVYCTLCDLLYKSWHVASCKPVICIWIWWTKSSTQDARRP